MCTLPKSRELISAYPNEMLINEKKKNEIMKEKNKRWRSLATHTIMHINNFRMFKSTSKRNKNDSNSGGNDGGDNKKRKKNNCWLIICVFVCKFVSLAYSVCHPLAESMYKKATTTTSTSTTIKSFEIIIQKHL